MGFTRKALFVATFGLSGLVFKDNSKKERPAKAARRQTRSRRQTKVTALKPPAARRREPQAARRPKAQATRRPKGAAPRSKTQSAGPPKTQAQRASTVAQTASEGNGTASELERIAALHGRGALTGEEFAAAKAKILGTSPMPDSSGGRSAMFPAVEANIAAARRLAGMAVGDGGAPVASARSD
jgi:hypothetical protein